MNSYLSLCRRSGVFVSYLKNEDVFVLYYPGPTLDFGQQMFKFEYHDMIFALNKMREELRANRYEYYNKKSYLNNTGITARGQVLSDILSGMFGYKMNDCLQIVFSNYCLSKTSLDKCMSLRKKSGGKRKVILKEKR